MSIFPTKDKQRRFLDSFLRIVITLPSPEALGTSFDLLSKVDEQLTIAIENESRCSGDANEKTEEKHKNPSQDQSV
jgi:hypothetical protein